jgi:hypothetical protein
MKCHVACRHVAETCHSCAGRNVNSKLRPQRQAKPCRCCACELPCNTFCWPKPCAHSNHAAQPPHHAQTSTCYIRWLKGAESAIDACAPHSPHSHQPSSISHNRTLCCTPDIVATCRRQCRNGNATRFVTVTLTLIRWSHCTSWTPAAAVTNHVTSAAAGESGMLLPSPLLPALVLPPAGRLLPRTRSARSSNNALYTNRYWSGVCSAQHSTAQHSK